MTCARSNCRSAEPRAASARGRHARSAVPVKRASALAQVLLRLSPATRPLRKSRAPPRLSQGPKHETSLEEDQGDERIMLSDPLLSQLYAFVSVVIIDLVLAGDNAIVVGMAASGLPREKQRRVIMIGIVLALVFRVIFALVAVQLLAIIGLLLAGGLLLLWVAWKMWRELHPKDGASALPDLDELGNPGPDAGGAPPGTKKTSTAIWQIAVADLSMSLDNVLAVAGAARDHMVMLVFGLVLAVALMGLAATFIAKLLARHHWLNYIGLGIITLVALTMIWEGAAEVWTVVASG
jgi:YjbE family integral membrane protein